MALVLLGGGLRFVYTKFPLSNV
ncbi:uncharacterized protein G2W53_000130 [Senna tora]|uniref:Uncharacterized protein n=1 Tax=Senna tora TaxID=362788 RepID=A0A835CKB0_9FABA|nr:uncharacterized protein G2W53_000130 [Senna tora]